MAVCDVALVASKRVCLNCKGEMWSKHRHDYVTCDCGACFLDGGTEGYVRTGGDSDDISVWSDAPFEVIRQNELRGGRGKDGRQPLTWVPIAKMSDAWLSATIVYLQERGMVYGQHYKHLLKEVEYREENNITVDDD